MTRVTTVSTLIGLVGLVLSMVAALGDTVPPIALLFGFALMLAGLFGAIVGAAASWAIARPRSG